MNLPVPNLPAPSLCTTAGNPAMTARPLRTAGRLPRLMRGMSLVVFLGLLGACAGPSVSQYAAERPTLELERFFAGRTQAWGMFQERSGEVSKRFHVQIDGRRVGEAFVLDEHFVYSDGTTQERVWTLRRSADGLWHGTAPDVVGEALGSIAGNALNWRYTLRVPVKESTYDLQFDDWMFLMDEHTMVNRASMSKFGIELGQVTLFFRHEE